mmetsp:Transcript_28425/g.50784  ORF Transcript_28425/g.50784 Transcript_28425/m.50784 type:complete len:202 (-) Transcript_28425:565-1170(-)
MTPALLQCVNMSLPGSECARCMLLFLRCESINELFVFSSPDDLSSSLTCSGAFLTSSKSDCALWWKASIDSTIPSPEEHVELSCWSAPPLSSCSSQPLFRMSFRRCRMACGTSNSCSSRPAEGHLLELIGVLDGFSVSNLDSTVGFSLGPFTSTYGAMGSSGGGGGQARGGTPPSLRLRTICCSFEFHRFFTSLSVRYTPK